MAVNFELFKSAPRHIKESRDKVLEAAEVDGRIIGFIKTNMRNDPEVAMTAVILMQMLKITSLKKQGMN